MYVGEVIPHLLDGEVLVAPVIRQPITGGTGQMTGNFTHEEARNIAIQLKHGALPVALEVESISTVGATLGKESVDSSLRAGVVGLVLVVLFMLAYYRLPGLLADLALGVRASCSLALLAQLGATLTLPGIAGFILSIGMAVDANVLIFERIKDELRAGKRMRAAVRSGFQRAVAAILDANLTSLITGRGAVLLRDRPGAGLRGDARSRHFGQYVHGRGRDPLAAARGHRLESKASRRLLRAEGGGVVMKPVPAYDFMRYGKATVAVSAALLVLSVLSMAVKGFNLGIDFTGGILLERHLGRPVTAADVREALQSPELADLNLSGAIIQPLDDPRDVLIRFPSDSTADAARSTKCWRKRSAAPRQRGLNSSVPSSARSWSATRYGRWPWRLWACWRICGSASKCGSASWPSPRCCTT